MSVQTSASPHASSHTLLGELWLIDRMAIHGAHVSVATLPTPEARRDAIRTALKAQGLDQVQCGRAPDRKPNTYAQAFKRLYGEDL